MRLGLTPWRISGSVDALELTRQASLAEGWGYESFWLPENHFTGDAAIPEPLMLLAAVAAGTSTIRLATTSYLLPVRHPLQAAEQVAVLDKLSGGRVVLGVGRGYATAMFSAFSVSRKDKREIFRDCLDVMMRAWQGEPVALDETSEPVLLSPLPVQKPHPPIWVAAFGPKALQQAGTLGFPYLASPMEPIDRLRENYETHRLACTEAGVQIPEEVPIMRTVFVSENSRLVAEIRDRLEEEARKLSESGIRKGMSMEVDDWAIVGEPSFVRDRLAYYGSELGMTHVIVTRLRIGKIESMEIERSVALTAALVV
ncbi:MAG: LLM class flavin-dependent oxidoreductase [Pseudomonadales bacterium]|nr:LLM class flavin-dependent oxidoreductase [Pseudomonadales bacterium]